MSGLRSRNEPAGNRRDHKCFRVNYAFPPAALAIALDEQR